MGLMDTHTDDIVDVNLTPVRKKRFRIDGDNARILELDTSDFSIITRLNTIYPKLEILAQKAADKFGDIDTDKSFDELVSETSDKLVSIDAEMREYVDELFGADVSKVCAPSGTMYDLFGGKFRYEHIIESIVNLYEDNINTEVDAIRNRVKRHTEKYTK